MKRKLYLTPLLMLVSLLRLYGQIVGVNSQCSWINGDSIAGTYGVYGTKGTPSPSNKPGGRTFASSWKDSGGNFWLFGGLGYAASSYGLLNDLWKYNPASNEWTWVSGSDAANQNSTYGTQGVPSISNIPGGRFGSGFWTDINGSFWLYGGLYGFPNSRMAYGDLWKYNPSTNEWTWISGSTSINQQAIYGTQGVPSGGNYPGGRLLPGSMTDSNGNFWLFGGVNYPGVYPYYNNQLLNDLWVYNPSTNVWTWINGSNIPNQPGIYGTQGVPNVNNTPGARSQVATWTDKNGNLWLFGGGFHSGSYNDLWRYNIATNTYTWMKGTNLLDQQGVYGTIGIPAPTNTPGFRSITINWTDQLTGDLFMYGGNNQYGSYSDLWKYSTGSNAWTWIKGDSIQNQPPVFGTKGTASDSTYPGNRYGSVTWQDAAGNAYLFSGARYPDGQINDLWKIDATSCYATGTILREVWLNINGFQISAIPYNSKTPNYLSYMTSFEGPTNFGSFFGERYRGFLCVPITGDYIFWIASDEKSELWLSADGNPSNRVKIAYVNGYTNPREYNKYPTQQSAPIHLIAGNTYYIEALHTEGVGNDNLSVGWQLPNGIYERPIPGSRLSPFINTPPKVAITSPTGNETFYEHGKVDIATTVSDSDGAVTRVLFYAGSRMIGEDDNAPFSVMWPNVPAGNHKLVAIAYDNDGGRTISDTVTIRVLSRRGLKTMNETSADNECELVSFPNPSSSVFYFDIPNYSNEEGVLDIVKPNGESIVKLHHDAQTSDIIQMKWDASDLTSGIYIYKYTSNGHTYHGRVVLKK